ncbi:MAG: hypothetical protein JW995_00005, partial [Melioribacteraceae bacterium]|nr:hypothetical protein [Melioribacteraceae bacterium]
MNKTSILFLVLLILILVACPRIPDELVVIAPPNQAPSIPINPQPPDNAVSVNTNLSFSWECSDPDEEAILYSIYLGTSNNPPIEKSNLGVSTYKRENLKLGTTYYWKIIAKDSDGAETSSPLWNFTTNFAPNIPSNPIPGNGAKDVSVTTSLSWTCSDNDKDYILYDIYLGLNSNPSLVLSNTPNTNYTSADSLNHSKTYFWKIAAKDEKNTIAISPLWSFATVGTKPSTPDLLSPSDGSTGQTTSPTLSWNSSDGAER